jgi:muramidase (phage lysozyme)
MLILVFEKNEFKNLRRGRLHIILKKVIYTVLIGLEMSQAESNLSELDSTRLNKN